MKSCHATPILPRWLWHSQPENYFSDWKWRLHRKWGQSIIWAWAEAFPPCYSVTGINIFGRVLSGVGAACRRAHEVEGRPQLVFYQLKKPRWWDYLFRLAVKHTANQRASQHSLSWRTTKIIQIKINTPFRRWLANEWKRTKILGCQEDRMPLTCPPIFNIRKGVAISNFNVQVFLCHPLWVILSTLLQIKVLQRVLQAMP